MPVVIGDGGGSVTSVGGVITSIGGGITSAELGGYYGGSIADYNEATQTFTPSAQGTGSFTPPEVALVATVEEKLEAIASGWVDSGGPGGHQAAVATEILRRVALLQGDLNRSVRQWAKPGRERALLEMMGVLVGAIHQRDRLLLELRERLNASPY